MTTPKDGGPAFPARLHTHTRENDDFPREKEEIFTSFPGLSLRDWFAGQADVSAYQPKDTLEHKLGRVVTIDELAAYIAKIRLIEADAMLAARDVQGESK